ncbi:hypothetical protein ACI794_19510, partial [Blastococcus sp. SYSU DS0541]
HSSRERADVLPGWLHTYNHHRSHTALDGQPPISRVNDLPGHYNLGPSGLSPGASRCGEP